MRVEAGVLGKVSLAKQAWVQTIRDVIMMARGLAECVCLQAVGQAKRAGRRRYLVLARAAFVSTKNIGIAVPFVARYPGGHGLGSGAFRAVDAGSY